MIKTMAMFGDEETNDFQELLDLKWSIEALRYFNIRQYYEKNRSMNAMLWRISDDDFRQIVRMNKPTFIKLVSLLGAHPVFHNNSRYKQCAAWVQIMVVLQKLGCDGNGNSRGRLARNCGYSNGAVTIFSRRVFTAILSLRKKVIKWPNARERNQIAERMDQKYGIATCGVLDGTPVVFSQKPHIDGETFYNRKSQYAINLQLICDDKKQIRYFISGWPGSCYDCDVFSNGKMFKNPESYFNEGEFLIADSGYVLQKYCCIPYKQPYAELPENKVFNELYACGRVLIEHVNGVLKARWSSLRGIRTQIRSL
jgi:hypothetical protein